MDGCGMSGQDQNWNGRKESNDSRREALWDLIYEKRGLGWSANPYVWVIEFKVTNAAR